MDESEVYKKGPYPSFAAALAEAKDIVDHFLKLEYKPGMTAEKLYAQYTTFGDDPAIVGPKRKEERFSAWDHAKQRCEEIVLAASVQKPPPPTSASKLPEQGNALRGWIGIGWFVLFSGIAMRIAWIKLRGPS